MKICMMIDSWLSDFQGGGGHVAVWQLATRLVRNYGCQVDLVVGSQRDSQGKKTVRIEEHLAGRLRIIRVGPCCFPAASMLGKLVYCGLSIPFAAQRKYDLINAHAFAAGFPGWVASRLAGIPVIYTIQGIGTPSMKAMVKNRLVARLLMSFETLLLFRIKYNHQISVSRDVFDYPNVNRLITIIPNGVDIDEFDAVDSEKATKFQILFVGRFHPQKGLFYLIEAVAQVVKKYPDIKVLMVGSGAQEQELRTRITAMNLDPYFEFAGHLQGPEKVRAFKSSHLFVLPSLYEGQPLTLLEAWAAKLPVVATRVGANPDFISDRVNGYLISPERSDLLAETIVQAIENPSIMDLGINGYNMVRKKYSWDNVAEQTHRVYLDVLKQH